jgi:hypothetical protein
MPWFAGAGDDQGNGLEGAARLPAGRSRTAVQPWVCRHQTSGSRRAGQCYFMAIIDVCPASPDAHEGLLREQEALVGLTNDKAW